CGFFFRRVPTGARLKGDTLKLEVYGKYSFRQRLIRYIVRSGDFSENVLTFFMIVPNVFYLNCVPLHPVLQK
ncbi:hypothetical protein, partial [Phocaeicola coprocola]|uniref:hypothetical protein n=1 Tax=Phocaeicola coprocola TaxID=310298 RepID=UPI001958BD91